MNKLIYFIIALFGLLPIIPNQFKGLPVILLVSFSLITYIKNKNKSINFKIFFIYSSLFLFYIISFIYSKNFNYGIKKIETSLSLLIFPILFFIFLKNYVINFEKLKTITLHSISIGSFVYSLIIIINFFIYKDPYVIFPNTVYIRASVEHIYLIGQHPIYSSLFLGIGLITSISVLTENRKWYFLIAIIINLLLVLMLASKSTIMGLFISALIILFLKGYRKTIAAFLIIFILGLVFLPTINQRISEIFNSKTYEVVDKNNSTSIRIGLFKSSITLLKDNWFLGVGIGDVKDEVSKIFNENFNGVGNYNTHNQYLGIWLGTGILGLLAFLYMLVYNFKLAIKNNDLLFLSILMFFSINLLTENLLERQSGVILFAFLINFFGVYNIQKIKKS